MAPLLPVHPCDSTTHTISPFTLAYDASGNRITKTVSGKTTVYVRDASGNVMAIYEKGNSEINNGNLSQTEAHLYGSSRLGIYNLKRNMENPDVNTTGIYSFERGNKLFELSNHLGNVLVTITDKKKAVDSDADGDIDYYEADVVSASDYLVFGMIMPGRNYSSGYRYGFNGKENDNEVKGEGNQQDYGLRIYDPRLGKFLSVDPITRSYPELTPYQFASNSPIAGVDLDGAEFRLSILDPNVTENFLWALNDGDIYRARRIIFDALHTKLTKDVIRNINDISTTTYDDKTLSPLRKINVIDGANQAILEWEKDTEGMEVEMNRGLGRPYNAKAESDFTFIWLETKPFPEGPHSMEDKNYPVDVRAFNTPAYTDYYKENDFRGWYSTVDVSVGGVTGSGSVYGYLKGSGYVQYAVNSVGAAAPFAYNLSRMGGKIWGNATTKSEFYDPSILSGWGAQLGAGGGHIEELQFKEAYGEVLIQMRQLEFLT
ncbi:RHS repeat domain-containing protein [Terrimonas pollutisoli]|uniref:RHS repeat domain-containing protein n=1 Tax=Terrimonas pollutisoli TaxID=3034147 RepID=UPI0023EC863D|nr:RHS repeat-associated core domain-containing protein [Terrimonas sp. H1YJ31]